MAVARAPGSSAVRRSFLTLGRRLTIVELCVEQAVVAADVEQADVEGVRRPAVSAAGVEGVTMPAGGVLAGRRKRGRRA